MAETSIFPASKSRQPDKKPTSKHFRKLRNSERPTRRAIFTGVLPESEIMRHYRRSRRGSHGKSIMRSRRGPLWVVAMASHGARRRRSAASHSFITTSTK
jgi:hypothetical protein